MPGDYIFEITGPDVKGESAVDGFKDMIDVESYSFGCSNSGSAAEGGGAGAALASFQDLTFTMNVNKASPTLMLAAGTGQHYGKGVLHIRKQGGKQEEFQTITVTEFLVSHYSSSASGGSGMDSFSINYAKIEYEYKTQDAKGAVGKPVKTGWDLKARKPV
jgi:type VI secretion system secreted protein Hcp